MPTFALARDAMNSRFEIVLHGGDAVSLRAAAEEALDESPGSKLGSAPTAARASSRKSTPAPRANRLHGEIGGAFDLTIAPLMRVWGFVRSRIHFATLPWEPKVGILFVGPRCDMGRQIFW